MVMTWSTCTKMVSLAIIQIHLMFYPNRFRYFNCRLILNNLNNRWCKRNWYSWEYGFVCASLFLCCIIYWNDKSCKIFKTRHDFDSLLVLTCNKTFKLNFLKLSKNLLYYSQKFLFILDYVDEGGGFWHKITAKFDINYHVGSGG